jgi:hypothetical protein
MWAPGVVEAEVRCQLLSGLGDVLIGVEINVLVLDALPDPLDEDVVDPAALAVHADHDVVGLEYAGEFGAGELAALVGVEDLRPAVLGDRLFQGLDAEVRAHADRHPMRQHPAGCPVDDGDQIDEAPAHGDIGNVGRPVLVGTVDGQSLEQVRVDSSAPDAVR